MERQLINQGYIIALIIALRRQKVVQQLINQGYIITLIALCRLKMERQLINQGYYYTLNCAMPAKNGAAID